jgi:hypothetical protein
MRNGTEKIGAVQFLGTEERQKAIFFGVVIDFSTTTSIRCFRTLDTKNGSWKSLVLNFCLGII